MTDLDLVLRHVHHKSTSFKVEPTQRMIATRKGMTVTAASEEEYQWILGMKFPAGSCNCGNNARYMPDDHGQPIYAPASEP